MKKQSHVRRQSGPSKSIVKVQRDLAIMLTSYKTIPQTLRLILQAACTINEADCGGIYLVDPDSGEYELVCHRKLSAAFVAVVKRFTPDPRQAGLLGKGRTICRSRTQFPPCAGQLSYPGKDPDHHYRACDS